MSLSSALADMDGRADADAAADRPSRSKRGGRGGGRGRGGRGEDSREVTISRKLSNILRHNAAKFGLTLDEAGFVNCKDLLNAPPLRSLSVTWAEVQRVVAENDKQRFELAPIASSLSSDPDGPSRFLIRARQGHSAPVSSAALLAPLDPSAPDCPHLAVHGTSAAAWAKILASGALSRMARGHVHFAAGSGDAAGDREALAEAEGGQGGAEAAAAAAAAGADGAAPDAAVAAPAGASPDALPVVSGMRASATVLVWVSVARAAAGGLCWWRSGNGVILTEGDARGLVSLDYVTRVERRSGGGGKGSARTVIWRPETAGR